MGRGTKQRSQRGSAAPTSWSFCAPAAALLCSALSHDAAPADPAGRSCAGIHLSIEVFDPWRGIWLPSDAAASLGDAQFAGFVRSVSDHVLQTATASLCPVDPGSAPQIRLVFALHPLLAPAPGGRPSHPDPEGAGDRVDCQMLSPWLQVSLARTPRFVLHATFVWDVRRLLLDQASLANPSLSPPETLEALQPRAFEAYVADYSNSILLAASPAQRADAQQRIRERIPADILWLFSHTWQSTFIPFSTEVNSALTRFRQRAAPKYAALSAALVDHCLRSPAGTMSFRAIGDVGEVFDLGAYRIEHVR